MRKILSSVHDILRSVKYSIWFAWRNAKSETILVFLLAIAAAVLSWITIDTTGSFVTQAEYVVKNNYQSEWVYYLLPSMIYLAGSMIAYGVIESLNWYIFGNWYKKLSYANTKEINIFKSSLNIAAFKSAEYADLHAKIENSDGGFNVRYMIVDDIREFFAYLVKTIVFTVGLMSYSPYYAIILLVPILLFAWNEYYFNIQAFKFNDNFSLANRKRSIMERVFNRSVSFSQSKTYNQTNTLIERINRKTNELLKGRNEFRKKCVTVEILIKITFAIIYTGVVVSVFKNIIFGTLAIGMGFVIVMAMSQFRSAVEDMVRNLNYIIARSKYVLMIDEGLFAIKPTIKTSNAVVPKFGYIPELVLENIHFTYPDNQREVLSGIDLSIASNSKIMIVGESGCGKTTLMQILLRQYDPTKGYIYASGVNLKNVEPNVWFETISVQMQEYEIFERKVSHEIASSVFDKPVDMDKVKWAAEVACCDTFIAENEGGYDTQIGVGFGGKEFSGGENQRIAVARTIYRDTPILILDEPDAKLDPINADKLFSNVLKMKDKTVIVVSHKVSRAHLFDNIVVIKDGKIDDIGSHEELYKKKGHYYDLLLAEKSEKKDD